MPAGEVERGSQVCPRKSINGSQLQPERLPIFPPPRETALWWLDYTTLSPCHSAEDRSPP